MPHLQRTAAKRPVLVAAVLPLALMAQSKSPQSQATFRAGIDVVRLDVSVLDKARRPIRGLTANDLTVLENGKPQPIVRFSAIDIPDAIEPPAGRKTIVLISAARMSTPDVSTLASRAGNPWSSTRCCQMATAFRPRASASAMP